VKKLKYNIRAAIIRFLLKGCRLLKGHCYCKNEFYYDTIKLKIKDLNHSYTSKQGMKKFSMKELIENNIWAPNKVDSWEELIEDIKVNGIKVNPKVIEVNTKDYKYEIYDGNHRIKVLGYLYGVEHEVTVDLYKNHKKYIPYYATMGIIDEIEYKKILDLQLNKQSKNKIYEA